MLALSVHIGVAVLFFFHAYLVATAQTNMHKATGTGVQGQGQGQGRVGNVYDRGNMRANFQEVFGLDPPLGLLLLALLPSTRKVHNSSRSSGGDGYADDYCLATGHFSRNRARIDTGYGNLMDV